MASLLQSLLQHKFNRGSTSQDTKRHLWLSAVQKNAKIIINTIVMLLTSGKVAVVVVRKAFRAGWVTLTAQPCLMWIYKKDFKGQACQIQGQCLLLTHWNTRIFLGSNIEPRSMLKISPTLLVPSNLESHDYYGNRDEFRILVQGY